jgi:hypothetical protein
MINNSLISVLLIYSARKDGGKRQDKEYCQTTGD